MTCDELIATVGAKKVGDTYMVKCPVHADKTASLSIDEGDDGKILLHCFAGCEPQKIIDAWNMAWTDLWPEDASPPERKKPRRKKSDAGATTTKPQKSRKPPNANKRIIAEYIYEDADGQKRYKVRRYEDKSFDQCRWAINEPGKAGWIPGIKGVELLLYRLPQLKAAVESGRNIFVVEGEKDVHTLESLGFAATTNSGGAQKKWLDSYSESLRGANVIVLPDNDLPGKAHAKTIMAGLEGVAAKTRVLLLPGLPDKGDVTDWVEAGGTPEQLIALVKSSATTDTTKLDTHRGADGYTQIDITDRCLREIGRDIINALKTANDPPYIYRYADGLARIRKSADGQAVEELKEPNTKCRIADVLNLVTIAHDGKISQHSATRDQIDYVLHSDRQPYPQLRGITKTPLLRPDGTVITKPGFDDATGYFYAPADPAEVEKLNIPDLPTQQDVQAAKELIGEVIIDFPFVDDASRANAIALMLTPLIRPIARLSPLTLLDATKMATGKTKLATIISLITVGGTPIVGSVEGANDEMRKRITALLSGSPQFVIFDNIKRTLSGEALATLLTSETWTDRILGNSTTGTFPNDVAWCATGNNIKTDSEIGRRSYLIKLDAKTSEPQKRTGWKHPDINNWVKQNRLEILSALFTLIRYWVVQGMQPDNSQVMGSYEDWTQTIGGILKSVGISGFLENQDDVLANADTESPQWEAFLSEWHAKIRDGNIPQAATIAELKIHLEPGGCLYDVLPDALSRAIKGGELNARSAGRALLASEGARFGKDNFRVERRGDKKRATLWTACKDDGNEPDGSILQDIETMRDLRDGNNNDAIDPDIPAKLDIDITRF